MFENSNINTSKNATEWKFSLSTRFIVVDFGGLLRIKDLYGMLKGSMIQRTAAASRFN